MSTHSELLHDTLAKNVSMVKTKVILLTFHISVGATTLLLGPILPVVDGIRGRYMESFNNYVTPREGRGLSDALRTVVNTKLKSVTKGEGGGQKSLKKALRNCWTAPIDTAEKKYSLQGGAQTPRAPPPG